MFINILKSEREEITYEEVNNMKQAWKYLTDEIGLSGYLTVEIIKSFHNIIMRFSSSQRFSSYKGKILMYPHLTGDEHEKDVQRFIDDFHEEVFFRHKKASEKLLLI